MQEGVGLAGLHVVHFFKRGVGIGKIRVVLGVLFNPLACYGFYSFQRLPGTGFGINRAEKTANVGLRWREHGQSVSRSPFPLLACGFVARAQLPWAFSMREMVCAA